VIENMQQLAGSLQYIAGWADMLEGLRRHAQQTDAALLPTTSAGPLSELRRVLAEVREFVETLPETQPSPSSNGLATHGGEPKRLVEKVS